MTSEGRRVRVLAALVGLTLGAGLLGACHLLAYGGLREQKAAPGQPCLDEDDCRTGFCADGVCCEEPCGAACMACNLGTSGTCQPRPVGPDPDEDCAGQCNGSGVCVEAGLVTVATIGDGTTQEVNALAVDDLDNVIVGGTYDGTLQLGSVKPPPTFMLTPFVATFSTNGVPNSTFYAGEELMPLTEADAFSVSATSTGDVVVAGSAIGDRSVDAWLHIPEQWDSPVTLGGPGDQRGLRAVGHPSGMAVLGVYGPGSAVMAQTSLPIFEQGAFVALLDDDGLVTAALGLGGSVQIGPGGIAVDEVGNVYVAGGYDGKLESGTETLLSPPVQIGKPPEGAFGGSETTEPWVEGSTSAIFVLRLAPDLSVTWAQKLSGSPDMGEALPIVAPLGVDRVAVVWNDASSSVAQLVALEGTGGTPLWSEALPATAANLAGDAAGPVIAGSIGNDPIAFASGELAVLGPATTAIVAAYDENGGQRWGRSLAPGEARAAAIDTQGHVVVGGSYSGVFDLGVGTPSSTADEDGFLAELNTEGQPLWQQTLASREPQRVTAMLPFQGDVIVGGSFSNAMSSGGAFLTGGDDGFVANYNQNLGPGWVLHLRGEGRQSVIGLAEGLIPSSNRRLFVAACVDEQVLLGTELVASKRGITVFDLDDSGTFLGDQHTIVAATEPDCEAPFGMAYFDNQIFLAGHLKALAFEQVGFLEVLDATTLEPPNDNSSVELEEERVTGLAVSTTGIVIVGANQTQGDDAFMMLYRRGPVERLDEVRFDADAVLVHSLDEDSVVVVLAASTTLSVQGRVVEQVGTTTNGVLGVVDVGTDEETGEPILVVQSLVGLGPMSPTALEIDSDGNVAIAGELTEPVVWNGQTLVPNGVDSFVLKVALDGTRLGFQHVSGSGNASLRALASGNAGTLFGGGSFDGSLLVGDVGEVYGSGTDGMLVQLGR